MEEVSECLRKGTTKLRKILEGRPESPITSSEYIALYTTVYNYCTTTRPQLGGDVYRNSRKIGDDMYNKYREELESYVRAAVLPPLAESHGGLMLRELARRWADYKSMVRWLSHLFNYLARFHIPRNALPTLAQVGFDCFRAEVHEKVRCRAVDAVLYLIERERDGREQVDRDLLKGAVEVFVEIGGGSTERYEVDLEAAVLDDTACYYSRKASRWVEADTCPGYMVKAEECLRKESHRAARYLHTGTKQKLLERVQQELLAVHEARLLEKDDSGCLALLRGDKIDDLSRMYRLFSLVPRGLEPIAKMFQQHVTGDGMALVRQAEAGAIGRNKAEKRETPTQEAALVGKVVGLHDKYLAYVEGCFQNHTLFHRALQEAFECFCNKEVGGSSSAELLADFCDGILKKGGGIDECAPDETLDKGVRLLGYLNDKDLFAEFCRKKLARRLLFDRGSSGRDDDLERAFLTKLKQQCGGQFTSKMEGMVTDLTLAKEHNAQFQEFTASWKPGGVDLTVTVLTTGLWPSYKSFDLNLPGEMVRCVEVFKEFYQSRTKHRKLTWVYSLGTCNLVGRFDAKPVELVVTTHQAATLLLFNTSHTLSYAEILEQLNLTDEDAANRILHSLSGAKYRILNRVPASSSGAIGPGDAFEFNAKFTDRMRRIRVPLPPADDQRKKVVEEVGKDRRHTVDAALVRIMKSRKVLGYQQLVAECVEQLRHMFKPDIKLVKKRVEDLVSRDYLQRDEENPNTFRYVA